MGKVRTLPARFPGHCSGCGKPISKGETIHYDPDRTKRDMVKHITCTWSDEMAKMTFEEARAALAQASNGNGQRWNSVTGEFTHSLDGELRQAARRLSYSLGWTSEQATAPGANDALRYIMKYSNFETDEFDDEKRAHAAAEYALTMLKPRDGKSEEAKTWTEEIDEREAKSKAMRETEAAFQASIKAEQSRLPTVEQAVKMNGKSAKEAKLAEAMAALSAAMEEATPSAALDEGRVRELIAEAQLPQQTTLYHHIDLTKSDGTKIEIEGVRHKLFPKALSVIGCGLNLYLCGPAGSGKTTLGENIAEALGLTFEFNGAITSKFELFGFKDAAGTYHPTAFRRAFENGGIYLADEIDAWAPQPLLSLNAALANGWCDFPDMMVKKHPDFRMMAAANTWGQGADREYVGRNQLDAASLDRFVFLAMDYDTDLERQICGNADWARRVQSIRKAVFSQKARMVVSPRASIHGAKLLQHFPQKEVEEMVIWKGVTQEVREKIENHLF